MKLVGDEVSSIEESMERYKPYNASNVSGPEGIKWVAETTQAVVTFIDALKFNFRAKDQLHPFLQEPVTDYTRFPSSKEWEGRSKLVGWLITLNGMKASEELGVEQTRQLTFDVENAYTVEHLALHTVGFAKSSCTVRF
ncbi:hypothetical protein D9758_006129 [Tetrapyrgos nigripes]|uniref:VPS28 C-terminal domain-containing protein n=1 Tax=Tetrapyrgos nigripes TaxID=182062 RepID=A0A8H5GAL2_9AGAR|nr:hypothetical protein D9758_006129 [Tetrapyrgos nigripes]